MADRIRITTPLTDETVQGLKAGDTVLISGVIYTGRDAAHKRIVEGLKAGQEPPFDLSGAVIYYVGPAPAKPGQVIGSAGPTTSGRMDAYAPVLLDRGLKGMIGKGARSKEVRESIAKNGAIYFAATGGAAALIARSIKKAEVIAYEDLGTEAVHRLEVVDFPAVVINDARGNDLYEKGVEMYRR